MEADLAQPRAKLADPNPRQPPETREAVPDPLSVSGRLRHRAEQAHAHYGIH
jgi:hypothetical protein